MGTVFFRELTGCPVTISPLTCGDSTGYVIQVAMHELLSDDIMKFVEKAWRAGIPTRFEVWKEMFFAWQIFSGRIPEKVRRRSAGRSIFGKRDEPVNGGVCPPVSSSMPLNLHTHV